MAKNAQFLLSYLRKLKPFLNKTDFKTAVQALEISRIKYGCTTLAGIPMISTAPLKACLKAAARLITGSKKFNHIPPLSETT